MSTQLPYLDAVIAEINRHDSASQIQVRVATTDTCILGHHIPRGTDVFFPICGPSFLTPPMEIDEKLRSASSRESKAKYGAWEPRKIGDFLPERWLVKDEDGNEKFDPQAGPSLPFGAGLRGCHGITIRLSDTLIR
jgi:cytochrome P450